jgi:hypothetical protein
MAVPEGSVQGPGAAAKWIGQNAGIWPACSPADVRSEPPC